MAKGYYGIADFANQFNKVREDALDSGFKAKNRFRADYLADYQMPGALAAIDARTAKAQQLAEVHQRGYDDFVNKGLYGIAKEAAQAKNDYDTYQATAPYLQQGSIHQAKKKSLDSSIDLQNIEAKSQIDAWRQAAIHSGFSNESDIQRFIYAKAQEYKGANPYILNFAHQSRTQTELGNALSSAALGGSDTDAQQFLNPNRTVAYDGEGNYVITLADDQQVTIPTDAVSSDAVIKAAMTGDTTGLINAQEAIKKHQNALEVEAYKASLKQNPSVSYPTGAPTAPTMKSAAAAFGGGEPPIRAGSSNKEEPKTELTESAKVNEAKMEAVNYVPYLAEHKANTGSKELDARINSDIERDNKVLVNLSKDLNATEKRFNESLVNVENLQKEIADINSELTIIDQQIQNNPGMKVNGLAAKKKLSEKLVKLNRDIDRAKKIMNGFAQVLNSKKQDYLMQQQKVAQIDQFYGISRVGQ